MTDGSCADPTTGYGVGASVFSISCDSCSTDYTEATGCILNMPFIGAVCPATPASTSTNNLITLTKCGYSDNQKWDFALV